MMLLATLVVFIFLLILSLPIAFSLGIAAIAGLAVGELPMQMIPSGLVSGSQNWILLAVPSFIFAGSVMERCGIAQALVTLARALIGWVRGGLGMSVVVSAYFFSDLSGSTMADVSALGTTLTKPLVRAGYRRVDAASLIASGTAMGMLVPPAIFMIVLGEVTNTSVVALFLAGFIPALIVALCLCTIIFIQAHRLGWPKDTRPSFKLLIAALRASAIPLVVPVVLVFGFYFGVFTATEAGAVVALYSIVVARFYYRNVSWRDIFQIAYESALLTAGVIFILAAATIFQYLMGIGGVPKLMAEVLAPLQGANWLFLIGVSIMSILIGMVLEGLPAAVILVPVVFPIAVKLGIHPIHFNIVQVAAVGIGLFLPPMGVGLLVALRFAGISVGQHFKAYIPYMIALLVGLMLIITIPELSLFLPRSAGFIR